MKKVGYFFYSLTPGVAFLFMQIMISLAISLMYGIVLGMQIGVQSSINNDSIDLDMLERMITNELGNTFSISLFFSHLLGILVFSLWYYFATKKSKVKKNKREVTIECCISLVLASIIFIIINHLVMYLIGGILDKILSEFLPLEQVQTLAQGHIGLQLVAIILLAPIGEEILFRGLTLHIARKCTSKFWIANIIQASMFSFVHLNIVQGIYAFWGGLLLGWLYKKYSSLFMVMMIHIIVNAFASFWGKDILVAMGESIFMVLGMFVLGICLFFILLFINKNSNIKNNG